MSKVIWELVTEKEDDPSSKIRLFLLAEENENIGTVWSIMCRMFTKSDFHNEYMNGSYNPFMFKDPAPIYKSFEDIPKRLRDRMIKVENNS